MSDMHDAKIVLDLDHLARQTFGDRVLEAEILSAFSDQWARLTPIIHGPDDAERRAAAHKLKGAALAIGAWQVAGLADAIETHPTGAEDGRKALSKLSLSMQEVLDAIRRLRP